MPEVSDNGTRVHWPESTTTRELSVTDADGMLRSLGDVDVVFPILHGPWGEDGTVQGMLELVDLPYVGSGVLASAIGMDKHFAKSVWQHAGLPVIPWHTVSTGDWADDRESVMRAADALGWPVIVKPARGGSSVGVSKAASAADLAGAVELALSLDDKALIETCLSGAREVEIGVLGGCSGRPARASVAGEIVLGERDFYDFDAKYLDAPGISLVCPAALSDVELAEMRRLALQAFDEIGAAGLARADFFLTEDGFVLNELNTMPGFTPISMFPKCWEASGLSYPDLISELIDTALAR